MDYRLMVWSSGLVVYLADDLVVTQRFLSLTARLRKGHRVSNYFNDLHEQKLSPGTPCLKEMKAKSYSPNPR